MNATFKKSIALASVIAIATVSTLIVNATNVAINGATASYATTNVTVTKTGVFTDTNEITFASIKNLDGTAANVTVTGYAASTGANNDSFITLSADPSTTDNNKVLVISFVTATGDFGTAQLTVGTPTNNVVQVSATVVPLLSMAISNASLALGNLSTSGYATANTTVTVATNAVTGASVSMTSGGLKDATINREIGVADIAGQTQTAATDYYKVSTNASPVIADANGVDITSAAGYDVAATQSIYSGSTPVASAATKVTVGAKIAADTEAGQYSDTLTFTVTGSF